MTASIPLTRRASVLHWLAAASLALGAFGVQAQTAVPQPPAGHHHADPAQRAAHHAQRVAEFKQQLNLSPNQEAAWAQYQAAMRPAGHPNGKPHGAKGPRGERPELTDAQKAELRQHLQAQRAAREQAKQVFYAQLSPAQQQVFDAHHAPRHGKRGHAPKP